MRPTIEEQLRGVSRLVDELAADPELSSDSATLARDAGTTAQTADKFRCFSASFLAVGQCCNDRFAPRAGFHVSC